ncbi:flagellar basal-body MS-ring/collar protein FliF [Geoalkalibacter sp.]|uniref:flagellar basal-body MS-ring/collar protein FliF n=1 Tax=Geoalkalibacter sp. TaxID=3041440 RepID=UPI00272DEA85|nr:flagellar basal-body MS-ring/collar protein FliF [Geoalkalibacter sp.]
MAEQAKKQPPKNLVELILQWPLKRKLSFAAVGLASLLLFGLIIFSARGGDYRLLYSNLDAADAGAVVAWLKENRVPYRLENEGRSIYLPADKVYEARLELAGAGIPQGGGIGFELFDKQSFGMTDFAQKVNYQRALQGELARTIANLSLVEGARVHLALPEKRLFREQQKEASASVILKLVPGRTPNEGQIQGIVHLVASSIEGLEPKNITVIDSTGRVLSKKPGDGIEGPMTPGMLDHQSRVERSLEERAQSLLDRALGPGNSMVRITAQLDFSQVEKTEELFDPNRSAVRSEQVMEEKSGQSPAGGIPGVESNLDGGALSLGGATSNTRSEETTNYEISKVVSRTVGPVGALRNVSVAVLVSDRPAPPGSEGPAFVPRNDNELLSIENMVAGALGLDRNRGDQIKVVSMPFENGLVDLPGVESSPVDLFWQFWPLIKYALLALGAVLVYLKLVRPMVKTIKSEAKLVEHYKTVQELETEMGQTGMLPGPKDPLAQMRNEVLAGQATPAQVIKTWLKES